MAVRVTAKFTPKDVHQMIADKVNKINAVILNRLIYVAEKFVAKARSFGSYKDQTGNLRNSIGYVVLHNGVLIKENFRKSASITKTQKSGKKRQTSGSGDGLEKSKKLIKEIQADFPKGFVLIVVAGMEYAAFVEAKGYDVITSASLEAVQDLKQAVIDIKSKLDKIK